MDDGKTFGQRLRETRINAGLSQTDLEQRSGIPKARLSRYENDHVAPSIHTLGRLAKALDVSEASLLGDQRAFLESFCHTLSQRGVQMHSGAQAVALANAVADLWEVIGGLASPEAYCESNTAPSTPAVSLPMAPVREWGGGASDPAI
jgi:transcriptional regulator with XRE-family HTH domain